MFVMTAGIKIDEKIAFYQENDDLSRAYVLDSVGSAAIALASSEALGRMEKDYAEQGLRTSIPLGPGHSYWKRLEDQQVLFQILQPERIGVTLNSSNLMLPKKSVSMVMGVGKELPEHEEGQKHCDFCALRGNCSMSRVVSGYASLT
ncbi:vitamin B12 dependent methionine synthase, activation domain [Peptococcaceae bacterium CEB3]|nr:vitamin B12 dependent methionine synthase, activation domain [Peptococcaceae bacterium CEB3]